MSPLSAGFRRYWAELEIAQGRKITQTAMVAEARAAGHIIESSTPWSIVLGTMDAGSESAQRLLSHLSVSVESLEAAGSAPSPGFGVP